MSIDLNHGPLRRVCRRAETAPGRANEAAVDGYRFSVRRPKCPQESTATAMSMSRVARGGVWPTSPTDSMVRAVAPTTRYSTPASRAATSTWASTREAAVISGSVESRKSIIGGSKSVGVLALARISGCNKVGVDQWRRYNPRVVRYSPEPSPEVDIVVLALTHHPMLCNQLERELFGIQSERRGSKAWVENTRSGLPSNLRS